MSPEKQRIKIAGACGLLGPWEQQVTSCGCDGQWDLFNPDGARLPDYLNDLNAMHDAEKVLGDRLETYGEWLRDVTKPIREPIPESYIWHATAAQRAEAFLKTLGLWEDAK